MATDPNAPPGQGMYLVRGISIAHIVTWAAMLAMVAASWSALTERISDAERRIIANEARIEIMREQAAEGRVNIAALAARVDALVDRVDALIERMDRINLGLPGNHPL